MTYLRSVFLLSSSTEGISQTYLRDRLPACNLVFPNTVKRLKTPLKQKRSGSLATYPWNDPVGTLTRPNDGLTRKGVLQVALRDRMKKKNK